METWMSLLQGAQLSAVEKAREEIRACNAVSARYGLILQEQEIAELAQGRRKALEQAGRVEFGGGILPKLIEVFCDSPFLQQESYAETLQELQEIFYTFKTEADERFTDDELLELLVSVFNGRAQGSTDYLSGITPQALHRYARHGYHPADAEEAGDLF